MKTIRLTVLRQSLCKTQTINKQKENKLLDDKITKTKNATNHQPQRAKSELKINIYIYININLSVFIK